MASRVLVGEHGSLGYGVFVSKEGVEVTGTDNDNFLFDSTANNVACQGQLLLWKEVTLTSGAPTAYVDFKSFGKKCFVQGTMSWTLTSSLSASDISCISESANTARTTAVWSHYGNVQNSSGSGDDLAYTLSTVFSGSGEAMTGRTTVTRAHDGETDTGNDMCVQLMVWTMEGI